MRRGFESEILFNQNEEPYAVFMGAGHCAEHEWGIKYLLENIAVEKNNIGLKKRKANKEFSYISFVKDNKKKEACILVYADEFEVPRNIKLNTVNRIKKQYDLLGGEDKVRASWDSKSFCCFAEGSDNIKFLEDLYNKAKNKEIVIFQYNINANNPFSKFGLIFGKTDNFDEKFKKEMEYFDQREIDLNLERENVFKEFPKLSKITSFQMKSVWSENYTHTYRRNIKYNLTTKYKILFQISTYRMELESGTYTIEEILQYIDGDGPIIKEKFDNWVIDYKKKEFIKEIKK